MRPGSVALIVLVVVLEAVPVGAQTTATSTTIAGRVVDESTGTPLADTRVFLYRQPNTGLQGVTLTDATGEYSFAGIPAGSYLLGMNKQGYFGTRRPVVVNAGPGAHLREVELRMAKGGEIAGRVLDS